MKFIPKILCETQISSKDALSKSSKDLRNIIGNAPEQLLTINFSSNYLMQMSMKNGWYWLEYSDELFKITQKYNIFVIAIMHCPDDLIKIHIQKLNNIIYLIDNNLEIYK